MCGVSVVAVVDEVTSGERRAYLVACLDGGPKCASQFAPKQPRACRRARSHKKRPWRTASCRRRDAMRCGAVRCGCDECGEDDEVAKPAGPCSAEANRWRVK